jgi:hypothetical protein
MGRFDALTQLEDTQEKSSTPPARPSTKPVKKKTDLLANQQTSKSIKAPLPPATQTNQDQDARPAITPPPDSDKPYDTSLLTTKEKTKYGTYLTEESIEKISIRAIQLKRDAHQIVQEAVNQYFDSLKK